MFVFCYDYVELYLINEFILNKLFYEKKMEFHAQRETCWYYSIMALSGAS